MSEILSEMNLTAIDQLYQYRSEGWALDIARIITSHRTLLAERDELRAEIDGLALERNLARQERDALKAELAKKELQVWFKVGEICMQEFIAAHLKDDRWDEGYRKACENISMIAKSFAEECNP